MERWARLMAMGMVGLSLASTQAKADDSEATNDTKCLIVSMNMMDSNDETTAKAAVMAMFYYLGRVDGNAPNFDLEHKLEDLVATMSADDMQSAARSCGATMIARGQALQDMGARLQKRANQPPQSKGAS